MAPGPLSSSPLSFTPSGANVYFAANDNATGFELWAVKRSTVAGALDFYTVAPCRVLDTRSGAPLSHGVARRITVAGACGIPADAKAVAGNWTVVPHGQAGHLTAYPAFGDRPPTSTLNFGAARTRANDAILPLGQGRSRPSPSSRAAPGRSTSSSTSRDTSSRGGPAGAAPG